MIRETIEKSLREQPIESFELINESAEHRGHAHATNESHFKLIVVSREFHDKSTVARHQLVYRWLADAFKQGLHALTISAYTPEEWSKRDE